jgi:hypothetical protein
LSPSIGPYPKKIYFMQNSSTIKDNYHPLMPPYCSTFSSGSTFLGKSSCSCCSPS